MAHVVKCPDEFVIGQRSFLLIYISAVNKHCFLKPFFSLLNSFSFVIILMLYFGFVQFEYTLTCAICTKPQEKEMRVLSRISQVSILPV